MFSLFFSFNKFSSLIVHDKQTTSGLLNTQWSVHLYSILRAYSRPSFLVCNFPMIESYLGDRLPDLTAPPKATMAAMT